MKIMVIILSAMVCASCSNVNRETDFHTHYYSNDYYEGLMDGFTAAELDQQPRDEYYW